MEKDKKNDGDAFKQYQGGIYSGNRETGQEDIKSTERKDCEKDVAKSGKQSEY